MLFLIGIYASSCIRTYFVDSFLLMKTKTPSWLQQIFSLKETQQLQRFIEDQLNVLLPKIETEESVLLDVLFLKAMQQRLSDNKQAHQHIYLEQFEIPQIVLFDIMIHKMPFVVHGHHIVNQAIAVLLQNKKSAVLMDVGIGRGLQMNNLLQLLYDTDLEELTIIGIEPFEDALNVAKETITKLAATLPFKVVFQPVNALVENIELEVLTRLIPDVYDAFIVNSAFTLHHIQQSENRQIFFDQLCKMGVDHIFLLEPNSNHQTDDWQQRIYNAYEHYGTIFRVIDELDILQNEKKGLKVFFGREIDDVVGFSDDQRYERHEEGERWINYLRNSGYTSFPFPGQYQGLEKPAIKFINDTGGYLKMNYDDITILSLISTIKQ